MYGPETVCCRPSRTSLPFAVFIITTGLTRLWATRCLPAPLRRQPPATRFDYPPGAVVRTVKAKGEITFQNRFLYLGAAFCAQPAALEPTAKDGLYDVRLHAYRIGQIDLRVPNSKPKGHYYSMAKPTDII